MRVSGRSPSGTKRIERKLGADRVLPIIVKATSKRKVTYMKKSGKRPCQEKTGKDGRRKRTRRLSLDEGRI